MVVEDTVVCDMAVRHDQIVVTDEGLSFGGGAAMDGTTLAHYISVANNGPGLFSVEFEILGNRTYHGGRKDMAVFANLGETTDGGIGINDGAIAYFYVAIDEYERTDLHIIADFGIGMNAC
jgi:hypothetical protein